MSRELRRVSIIVLAMFAALFLSTSIIQVGQSDNLRSDPRNTRTILASFSAERGDIIVGGQPIASSTPVDDDYQFLRQYANGPLYAPATGYSIINGEPRGVEGALNRELAGTADSTFLARLNQIITGQRPKGASVTLTLDANLQQVAWDALGDKTGAVVALNPKTGQILAMVSKPSYDPNQLASHNRQEALAAYDALVADPTKPLQNRAIAGDLYAPGSTFKLITTATALESGDYTPDSEFPNPGSLTLTGTSTTITNSEGGSCGGGATASIATALRLSCNIPFAQLGGELGAKKIQAQAEKFGFGDDEIDIPQHVTPSQYPLYTDAAKVEQSAFGQADDRVTPLQMAMVSAGIANGGIVMKPNLVQEITAPDLSPLQEFKATEYGRAISEQTATTMTQMMINGVNSGAASNARISGVQVAGKTGTAQNGVGDPYTLWFTGFAPADDPQIAVAVVVANGGGLGQNGFGNTLAAPIAKKVMEAVVKR
ncbi:penicillin-binding transpeptidase domain-containing protein [Schumannella luteola]|uniref:Peptidoglycan glycosyltransferase n=1 Tax=Schumannella luteola TaxID=472059 RepID=A0A852Y9N6_9MICO|nr:penicillin-binding protein 2 [Schumannella luteola]NYG98004.1 peptidoglycan glycosyltransferase [Schumannella luteola]TPX01737.1 penicillin-binding protein 2 [Schumannella luteola]